VAFLIQLRNKLADEFLSSEPATAEGTRRILPWMYVAEVDGKSVGTFSLYNQNRDRGSVEFGRFAVEPAFQGRGYGRVMLKGAIAWAREMGFISIILTVKPDNEWADALYRDAGFRASHLVMELTL
jgi:mycothiol synthase